MMIPYVAVGRVYSVVSDSAIPCVCRSATESHFFANLSKFFSLLNKRACKRVSIIVCKCGRVNV